MFEAVAARILHGANVWANQPVLETRIEAGDWADRSADGMAPVCDRLRQWFSLLLSSPLRPASLPAFLDQLARGLSPGDLLAAVALELERLAGADVDFARARRIARSTAFLVAVQTEEERLAQACLKAAVEVCRAASTAAEIDMAAKVRELRVLAEDVCVGPSTRTVLRAAVARGIPVRRLNDGSLFQLGHGVRQRRVCAGETNCTGAIAETISQNKQLTKALVQAAGVPVPEGRLVADPDDAWAAACDIGPPVVMKPLNGNHGRGVFTDLTTRQQLADLFPAVLAEGDGAIVERCVPGAEHRLLVVGGRVVAAARGEPVVAIGDGRRSVTELIDELNRDPRRGDDAECPLAMLEYDPTTLACLRNQGFAPESVPPAGTRVLIQRNGNSSMDVTDRVHPAVARCAVRAARAVGLDVAGLDIVAEDIGCPLEAQGGAVVEVNAGPGLLVHLRPAVGRPQPVGEAIINHLFPPGENGRIPLFGFLTGTAGHAAARWLAATAQPAWGEVGLVCPAGVSLDGQRVLQRTSLVPDPARTMLLNPYLAAAVFELHPAETLANGLPFDACHVAVLDLPTAVGIPLGTTTDADDPWEVAARVLLRTLLPSGAAVLSAADNRSRVLAAACRDKLVLLAADPNDSVLQQHRGQGGRSVCYGNSAIVASCGTQETGRVPFSLPTGCEAHVSSSLLQQALTVAAAAWAAGLPWDAIRTGLAHPPSDG